jgi:hypothetical protein
MAARPTAASRLHRIWLPLAVGLLSYATALARGPALLDDPDVYLHVAVGRWIIAHRTVPDVDIFSYTMSGSPWVPHEWLSEIAFALVFDHAGWLGLMVVVALAFAVAMMLLSGALLAFMSPLYAAIGVVTAWGLCFPNLLARPHLLAFPVIVAWTATLIAARSRDRAPSPSAALLMLLWANLHGSFMLGLVLAAMFAGEALLDAADRRAMRAAILGWGAFGLLSLAAALATPNGLAGFLLPIRMVRQDFALALISEWQSPNFQRPQPLEIWIMLLLLGALVRGIRLPITRIVMLLVVLHLALLHIRNVPILGLIAPLLIAPALPKQLPPQPEALLAALVARRLGGRRLPAWSGAAAFGGALLLAAAATLWPRGTIHGPDRFTPAAALAAASRAQATGPVFNDFNFGSFLIFSGIPTFVDGRADMYGDRFLRRYASPDALPGILAQYRIGWTLLGVHNPDVALLDHLPGWRRLYADDVAVVHVQDPATER